MMLESSQAISLRAEEMNKSELGISVIDVPTAQHSLHRCIASKATESLKSKDVLAPQLTVYSPHTDVSREGHVAGWPMLAERTSTEAGRR